MRFEYEETNGIGWFNNNSSSVCVAKMDGRTIENAGNVQRIYTYKISISIYWLGHTNVSRIRPQEYGMRLNFLICPSLVLRRFPIKQVGAPSPLSLFSSIIKTRCTVTVSEKQKGKRGSRAVNSLVNVSCADVRERIRVNIPLRFWIRFFKYLFLLKNDMDFDAYIIHVRRSVYNVNKGRRR